MKDFYFKIKHTDTYIHIHKQIHVMKYSELLKLVWIFDYEKEYLYSLETNCTLYGWWRHVRVNKIMYVGRYNLSLIMESKKSEVIPFNISHILTKNLLYAKFHTKILKNFYHLESWCLCSNH